MTDERASRPDSLAETARTSPKSVFDTPEDVVEENRLTPTQKREVLDQWQSDAEAEQVATDEGMPAAPSADELEQVNEAKTEVETTGAATETET